jgi:hypothetical protein
MSPDRPRGAGADGERAATMERLSSLGEWEMYRLVDEEASRPVCSVALRAPAGTRAVEYAVWRAEVDREEPGSTGTVQRQPREGEWDDDAREDVLRQLLYRYEADLGVPHRSVEFELQGLFAAGEEEEDEHGDHEPGA